MNVHVPAYNHELREGVPHSRIDSHFEIGMGTWNIEIHNDGRHNAPKVPEICSGFKED